MDSRFHTFSPISSPFPSFPLRGKLEGWVVCSPNISAFHIKMPFVCLFVFGFSWPTRYTWACEYPVCASTFLDICTRNTQHTKKEANHPFIEAHKPQWGVQWMTARVFDGIYWCSCVLFCFLRQSEFSTTLPFSPLGERVASPELSIYSEAWSLAGLALRWPQDIWKAQFWKTYKESKRLPDRDGWGSPGSDTNTAGPSRNLLKKMNFTRRARKSTDFFSFCQEPQRYFGGSDSKSLCRFFFLFLFLSLCPLLSWTLSSPFPSLKKK